MPPADRPGRATVRSRSPGSAIDVILDLGRAPRLAAGPAGIEGHTERSLTAEIDAALAAAVRGAREAVRRDRDAVGVRDARDAARRNGDADRARDPVSVRRRDRARDAVAALSVTATSPSGVVVVTQTGTGPPTVRLCPGLLKRLTDDRLLAELNAALADTSRQLTTAILTIHSEHYSAAAARRDRDSARPVPGERR